MDVRIGNLMRLLQGGPFTSGTLRQVEAALSGLRGHRDLAVMRADLLVLLDDFAEEAGDGATSAAAYLLAADLCEQGEAREQFVERLVLAMHANPTDVSIAKRLRSVLSRAGERPRLQALLAARARALAGQDGREETAAAAYDMLAGELDRAGDVAGAIEAREHALELDATLPHVRALADLYARRADTDDIAQAADLYCLLAEMSPPGEELGLLERALRLLPDHAEAKQRRSALLGEASTQRAVTAAAPERSRTSERSTVPASAQPASAPVPSATGMPSVAASQASALSAPTAATASVAPTAATASVAPTAATASVAPNAATASVAPNAAAAPSAPATAPTASAVPTETTPSTSDGGVFARPPADAPVLNATEPGAPLQPTHVSATPRPSRQGADAHAPIDSLRPAEVATGQHAEVDLPLGLAARLPAWAKRPPMQWAAAAAVAAAFVGLVVLSLSDGASETDAAAEASEAAEAPGATDASSEATSPAAAKQAAKGGKPDPHAEQGVALTSAARKAHHPRPRRKRAARGDVRLVAKKIRVRGARIPKAKLRRALGKRVPKLQRCYRAALKRKPRMHGYLVFGMNVRGNGRVRSVKKVDGDIRDRRLHACAARALKGARLPRFKGKTAKVRVPMRFEKRR